MLPDAKARFHTQIILQRSPVVEHLYLRSKQIYCAAVAVIEARVLSIL